MKKLMFIVLCLLLLSGCGAKAPAEATTEPMPKAGNAATEPESADKKALAETCIDQDVSVLYDLIGEPVSSEYVSSCMGDGQDGNLYYDGFTVYTYKDAAGEKVTFVE